MNARQHQLLQSVARGIVDFVTLAQVTDLSAKMTPIVIADIRAGASGGDPRLEKVVVPPRHSFWGDITMPMF